MRSSFEEKGYDIVEAIYTAKEVSKIISLLDKKGFKEQFGIRSFLKDNPDFIDLLFTPSLLKLIHEISPNCDKSIKSIYFNKPPTSNWIVNWHQDLTINLQEKREVPNYINWREKDNRVIVQPNTELLQNIFTLRIHLDDCTKENGAVKVIESSHTQGIIEIKEWLKNKKGKEVICEINAGGVMLMKPLTLHFSNRTENNKNRRVIHIEFTDKELPHNLTWKEMVRFNKVGS